MVGKQPVQADIRLHVLILQRIAQVLALQGGVPVVLHGVVRPTWEQLGNDCPLVSMHLHAEDIGIIIITGK